MTDTDTLKASPQLKLLPAYTGLSTLEEVLKTPRALRLLWLEILVNETLDLRPWEENSDVQEAFTKACRWYTQYRTVINSILRRTPLPEDFGETDHRDYLTFAEALRFVANHD